MAEQASLLAKFDDFLAQSLAEWNIYTTLIVTLIVVYLGYIVFFSKDPDAHPYLLARQATEAPIRQAGESATFRALDVPYGYPLRTGLGVKDPGAPKWTYGRDGDLRDIWRSAVRGVLNQDGTPSGKRGKIYTVLGRNVAEHSLDDISREINIIGQYICDANAKTVAVCLTDSVELLAALFGSSPRDLSFQYLD